MPENKTSCICPSSSSASFLMRASPGFKSPWSHSRSNSRKERPRHQQRSDDTLSKVQAILNDVESFTDFTATTQLDPLLAEVNASQDDEVKRCVHEAKQLPTTIASVKRELGGIQALVESWKVDLLFSDAHTTSQVEKMKDNARLIRSALEKLEVEYWQDEILKLSETSDAFRAASLLSASLMLSMVPLYDSLSREVKFYEEIDLHLRALDEEEEDDNVTALASIQRRLEESRLSNESLTEDSVEETEPRTAALEETPRSVSLSSIALEQLRRMSIETDISQLDSDLISQVDQSCPTTPVSTSPERAISSKRLPPVILNLDQRINRIVSAKLNTSLAKITRNGKESKVLRPDTGFRSASSPSRSPSPSLHDEKKSVDANDELKAGWYTITTTNDEELSLYCRVVGNLVMVRVGGGWEELGSFLMKWSSHRTPSKKHDGSPSTPKSDTRPQLNGSPVRLSYRVSPKK